MLINLEVDGKPVEVPNGATVMDAANKLGIYVPHFCYHKKLSIAANCRMCLVQVEKAPKPLPACATPATEGMKVWTHSDAAVDAQKGVMEFLLINHPLDCPICDQGGECQLQDLAVGYGASNSRYTEDKRVVFNKNLGPLDLHRHDALHPLHALRALRPGNRRRHGARHGRARRARRDPDLRRQDGRFRALRQHDRPVPGRRAHLEAVPLLGARRGSCRAARSVVAARRAGLQPHRAGRRTIASCACCRSRTRRSTSAGSPTATASRTKA